MQEQRVTTKPRLEDLFEGKDYTVFDLNSEKIGKVDDLYIVNRTQPRYLGVKMGLLGAKMTLIPIETITKLDSAEKAVWVSIPRDVAKSAPVYPTGHAVSADEEATIWKHYGLTEPHRTFEVTEVFEWRQA